jgi:signal peptidase I
MNLNWFLSRKVRHADQMAKHVRKILNAQRDILGFEAIQNVQKSVQELCAATRGKLNHAALDAKMTEVETVANKWLKPYPNPAFRENIEVLLVAIAVAMAIRTFFLQPFKIPTGSMQPTLFGITQENLIGRNDVKIPDPLTGFFTFWFRGISYTHVVAKADGNLNWVEDSPKKFLLFNLKQSFKVGEESYTVWFPPDNLFVRAELASQDGLARIIPREFKKGDDIIKLKVISGDHLFVDRVTYNFRRPTRGEIIVFQTKGIDGLPQDQFYIKRLVGLGGERVRIGNDRHLRINGRRLEASVPHFENVYSFDPNKPPQKDFYSGHVNDEVAAQATGFTRLAPLFPDPAREFVVSPNHYIVMGDNTMNSSDSRTWGDFPEENVIGKSFFVYWPIGRQDERASRFGWGIR